MRDRFGGRYETGRRRELRDVGSPASIASERGDGERAAGGEDCVKPGPENEDAAKDSPSLGLVWRSRGSVRLTGPTFSVCAATAGRTRRESAETVLGLSERCPLAPIAAGGSLRSSAGNPSSA